MTAEVGRSGVDILVLRQPLLCAQGAPNPLSPSFLKEGFQGVANAVLKSKPVRNELHPFADIK